MPNSALDPGRRGEAGCTLSGFAASAQKGILWWIKSAKTAAKRVAETARLAALGLRAQHPEAKGR